MVFFLNNKFTLKLILFFLVLFVHSRSKVITQLESVTVIPTSISLVTSGNIDLNEYSGNPFLDDKCEEINGKKYGLYPIGNALLSAPIILFLLNVIDDTGLYNYRSVVERFVASIIVALCSILGFEIMVLLNLGLIKSLMLSFVFAFSTCAWSIASRALWEHSQTVLLILISIYIILFAEKKRSLIQFLAIPASFSFFCSPINIIFLTLCFIYICIEHKEYLVRYLMWTLIVEAPFFVSNYFYFGAFFSNYYLLPNVYNLELGKALLVNLFSPNRGLFFWHPVFLFSFISVYYLYRASKLQSFEYLFIVHFIVFSVFIASSNNWWGGHSIGQRYYTDMLPYLLYFLGKFVFELKAQSPKLRNLSLGLIIVFSLFGSFVHGWAANNSKGFTSTVSWNSIPNDIELNKDRIWDFCDLQYFRGTMFSKTDREWRSGLYKPSDLGFIKLKIGDSILFNSSNSIVKFDDGWSSSESTHRWNDGHSGGIFFNMDMNNFPQKAYICIKGNSFDKQKLNLFLNDVFLGSQNFTDNSEQNLKFIIRPEYFFKNESNYLIFELPDSKQPSMGDTRILGLALKSILFEYIK